MKTPRGSARDARITAAIASWFRSAARPLPWRIEPRDPYLSLLSEFMLQQTQVSRVLEKWDAFVARFPGIAALAAASEDDVLAAWSGLGYYRRARLLHQAAREVVAGCGGQIPGEVDALRRLSGVGRYTAGAMASMVFGRPAAIVDGNVRRVLLRVEGVDLEADEAEAWAWERAEKFVAAAHGEGNVAAFNEGLMELGATVCVPKSPRCQDCPVARNCRARAAGLTDRIPRPKARTRVSVVYASSVVVRVGRAGSRGWLIEQRPQRGLWARLWQVPTLQREDRHATRAEVSRWLGLPAAAISERSGFDHQTTHRRVCFKVWAASVGARHPAVRVAGRRIVTAGEAAEIGMSNAQRRILAGAEQAGTAGALRCS